MNVQVFNDNNYYYYKYLDISRTGEDLDDTNNVTG